MICAKCCVVTPIFIMISSVRNSIYQKYLSGVQHGYYPLVHDTKAAIRDDWLSMTWFFVSSKKKHFQIVKLVSERLISLWKKLWQIVLLLILFLWIRLDWSLRLRHLKRGLLHFWSIQPRDWDIFSKHCYIKKENWRNHWVNFMGCNILVNLVSLMCDKKCLNRQSIYETVILRYYWQYLDALDLIMEVV